MKAFKILTFFVALTLMVSMVAYGALSGSAHDFSNEVGTRDAWNAQGGSGGQCAPCHTPHNAVTGSGPLWSHDDPGSTYIPYDSPTMDASPPAAVSAVSKGCLSCHDGAIALDQFVGTSTTNSIMLSSFNAAAVVGTDLTSSHPISFAYADGGSELKAAAGVAAYLYDGKVECVSCHDVHNTANVDKLLLISNAGSALCITCHDK